MNRKLGAPSGAFFGVNGVQSGFESRTSSLMTPLNPDTFCAPLEVCCDGCSTVQAARAAASPSAKDTNRALPGRSIIPLLFLRPARPEERDDSNLGWQDNRESRLRNALGAPGCGARPPVRPTGNPWMPRFIANRVPH